MLKIEEIQERLYDEVARYQAGVLVDWQIAKLASLGMISPVAQGSKQLFANADIVTSTGISSTGYNATFAGDDIGLAVNQVVDEAGTVFLCHSAEYFILPDNLVGLLTLKSTAARAGLTSPSTKMEAGWHGNMVFELTPTVTYKLNAKPYSFMPFNLLAGASAFEITFLSVSSKPVKAYGNGKYQGQRGIQQAL